MLDALLRDPDGAMAEATPLKKGDRTSVARLDGSGGPVVVKRSNRMGPLHTAVHLAMRSRAEWCRRNAERLRAAGLETPAVLAVVEERIGPLRGRSWVATEFVAGPTLAERVARDVDPSELEPLVAQMTRIWKALGRLRAGHGDMKALNFIVGVSGELWMIDLDGMRLGLPAPLFRRQRRRDRARFLANWPEGSLARRLFAPAVASS